MIHANPIQQFWIFISCKPFSLYFPEVSKPAEEPEAPCPSKANLTLEQRPDQVLKDLTPITPAEQRKRGDGNGKGRGRGKGRGKGGRGKAKGRGQGKGGKVKSKGSAKNKSVRGKDAAKKKSPKKALPKSKTTKKRPSSGSSQPPAEQVKSRKRRSAAVSPEERLARKQQLSRKSSAYHKAKLRAMKQNLPDDECLRLAKQVTCHELIIYIYRSIIFSALKT